MARFDPFDPYSGMGDETDRAKRLDSETQVDPVLTEGRASSSKVTLLAIGIALVLAAVFYGLNNTSVHEASTSPPAQTAQTQPANPNSQPGVTTGAAPSRPAAPQPSPAASPSAPK